MSDSDSDSEVDDFRDDLKNDDELHLLYFSGITAKVDRREQGKDKEYEVVWESMRSLNMPKETFVQTINLKDKLRYHMKIQLMENVIIDMIQKGIKLKDNEFEKKVKELKVPEHIKEEFIYDFTTMEIKKSIIKRNERAYTYLKMRNPLTLNILK